MRAGKFVPVAFVAMALLSVGCVTTSAPDGWLPDAGQAETNAFGGWVEVEYSDSTSTKSVDGELIAAESSLVVLSDSGIHRIDFASIKGANLMGYEIHAGRLAGWMFAGMVSTLSHGFFLILTVPAWAITGGISAGSTSQQPLLSYPDDPLRSFRLYARFPQGLPSGVDPLLLKRKPLLSE